MDLRTTTKSYEAGSGRLHELYACSIDSAQDPTTVEEGLHLMGSEAKPCSHRPGRFTQIPAFATRIPVAQQAVEKGGQP